jgi:Protein of unknown function (DUF1254)
MSQRSGGRDGFAMIRATVARRAMVAPTADQERNGWPARRTGPAMPDEQTAYDIGVEGYTYLYPLVLVETTRRQMTNVERVGEVPLRGPADAFVHAPAFPTAEFRDVVRPNFDTLYSAAWLDLRDEPRIVSARAAGDKYYLLPLYDSGARCSRVRARAPQAVTRSTSPSSDLASSARFPLACTATTPRRRGCGSSAGPRRARRPTTRSMPSRADSG